MPTPQKAVRRKPAAPKDTRKAAPKTAPAVPTTPAAGARDFTLRIHLIGSNPLIWRRVRVPDDLTLGDLHYVIQTVFEWENSHLHGFTIQKQKFGMPTPFDDLMDDEEDEDEWLLAELLTRSGQKFEYEYDFGDSWAHQLVLEKITPSNPDEPRRPICLGGERAGPLEDSGGIWGYEEKVEALQNPDTWDGDPEELEEIREWMGEGFDPEAFSVDEVNQRLKALFRAGGQTAATKAPAKTKSAKAPAGRGLWAGAVLHAKDMLPGIAPADADAPVLACWFDISNPEQFIPLAAVPGLPGDQPPPLITAFQAALAQAQLPPAQVIAPTPADVAVLTSFVRQPVVVDRMPHPELTDMILQMFLSVREAMEQESEAELRLEDYVPVPDEPGIDEELARSWCTAALDCWKTQLWKNVSDTAAFELHFPGGAVRVAGLIGQAQESFGILLYETADDFRRMAIYSSEIAERNAPPEKAGLPLILSLNFEFPDDLPESLAEGLAEYFKQYLPSWQRQRVRPCVLKVGGTDEVPEPVTFEDFIMTGQAAAALTLLSLQPSSKKGSWVPALGHEIAVRVPWRGTYEVVSIRYLGELGG